MPDKKKKHAIKLETKVKVGPEEAELLEGRRAAIKAALNSAVAGLAATTSNLGTDALAAADPPWGEVVIGPVWEQKKPEGGGTSFLQNAELFWE